MIALTSIRQESEADTDGAVKPYAKEGCGLKDGATQQAASLLVGCTADRSAGSSTGHALVGQAETPEGYFTGAEFKFFFSPTQPPTDTTLTQTERARRLATV